MFGGKKVVAYTILGCVFWGVVFSRLTVSILFDSLVGKTFFTNILISIGIFFVISFGSLLVIYGYGGKIPYKSGKERWAFFYPLSAPIFFILGHLVNRLRK
jgi:hypothetical protein